MPVRHANARWEGTLQEGKGVMRFQSGAFEGQYSFGSRFEEGTGTNPEELIAAAHAGCFSMALSAALGRAEHPPTSVETRADVHLERGDAGFSITKIVLNTTAVVPGISDDDFQRIAEESKKGCPVSKALAGTEICLNASLSS